MPKISYQQKHPKCLRSATTATPWEVEKIAYVEKNKLNKIMEQNYSTCPEYSPQRTFYALQYPEIPKRESGKKKNQPVRCQLFIQVPSR